MQKKKVAEIEELETVRNKCSLLSLEIEELKQRNNAVESRNKKYEASIKQANIDIKVFKDKCQENYETECARMKESHQESLNKIRDDLFKQLMAKDLELENMNIVRFFCFL